MADPYFEQKRKEGSYKRWEAISRYLPKEPQTILDIGCNTGFFSFAAAAGKGVKEIGKLQRVKELLVQGMKRCFS